MNNQIKGLLNYYALDLKYSAKIFWSIAIGLLVVSSVVAYLLLDVEESRFYFAVPFMTYFNVAIVAFQSVKGNIPFGLKMGAVRKNIYLGHFYFFMIYSFLVSIAGNTLQFITESLHHVLGISNFIFSHPAMLMTDTWLTRTIMDTFIMFFLMSLLFLVGLIFYRSGLLGGGVFLGVFLVVFLYGLFEGWLIRGFAEILPDASMLTFATLFLIGIGLYLISYPLIRKITVVQKV